MAGNKKLNLHLVKEIKRNPCLYDDTKRKHAYKEQREEAWNKVSQNVNLSASKCKAKWKNLRWALRRHMREKKISRSGKMRKSYYMASAMKFACPYMKTNEKSQPTQQPFQQLYRSSKVSRSTNTNKSEKEKRTSISSPTTITPPSNTGQTPVPSTSDMSLKPSSSVNVKQRKQGNRLFLKSINIDLDNMDDGQSRQFKKKVLQVMNEVYRCLKGIETVIAVRQWMKRLYFNTDYRDDHYDHYDYRDDIRDYDLRRQYGIVNEKIFAYLQDLSLLRLELCVIVILVIILFI